MTKKIDESHISDLQYDPRNARKRTIRSSAMIQSSLQEVGASRSIVIDEHNRILAGNGTIEAAGQIGIEKMIIVDADGETIVAVRRSGLTEQQKIKLALFDNRTSDLSEWDADVLAELGQEVDLSGLFTENELAVIPANNESGEGSGEEDEEKVSALIDEAESGAIESRVSLGQIWKLGRHYIACGDSTNESNVKKLLGDRFKGVGMVWADPPYGMGLDASYSSMKGYGYYGGGKKHADVIGDEKEFDPRSLMQMFSSVKEHFWWGSDYYAELIPEKNDGNWLVWDKRLDEDADRMFGSSFELVWMKQKHKRTVIRLKWHPMFSLSQEDTKRRVHPTQKPTALCEWCFEKYGKPDDLIFDPFLGSAPSIIAAQQMEGDRAVFGFELSEAYCEVICRRFESLTGINAELVGNLTT